MEEILTERQTAWALTTASSLVLSFFGPLSMFLSNFEQIDKTLMRSRQQFKADDIIAAGKGLKKEWFLTTKIYDIFINREQGIGCHGWQQFELSSASH